MKKLFPCPWPGKGLLWLQAILAILFLNYEGFAQASKLVNNTNTPIVSNSDPLVSFSNLTVNSSTALGDDFSNKGRIADDDLGNSAQWTAVIALLKTLWIEVKDNNATSGQVYPGGSFAGFVIEKAGLLEVGASTTITTYLGASSTPVETHVVSADVLGLLTGSKVTVGFNTVSDFDRVRITFVVPAALGATRKVYHAVVKKYAAGGTMACNTPTALSNPAYPAAINYANSGLDGIAVGAIDGYENVVSPGTSDFATINVPVGLLGASASLAVQDRVTDHPIGTFVGFDIESSSLLSLKALSTIEIKTFLNGAPKETVSGTGLLVGAGLLSSTGRQTVGFVSGTEVDEVVLVLKSGLAAVNLGETKIYSAIFQRFCLPTVPLACNEQTILTVPRFPVIVNSANTGVSGGLGVNADLKNTSALVDDNTTNFAEIVLTGAVLISGSVAVKDVKSVYPAGTFAGFDLEIPTLASVNVLSGIRVATYLAGNPTGEFIGSGNLAAVGSSIVAGSGRQTIGFLAQNAFDEIKLTVEKAASVDVLGSVKVFGAVAQKFCLPDTELDCNVVVASTNPARPVFVDGRNTGVDGLVCAGCSINNSERVIDGNSTNYATMILAAGVGTSGSFAVANALETYPEKTFAGFDIATATLLSADILGSSATIQLLNDGAVVQTGTGNALLVGVNTSLLTEGLNRQTIGIVANAGIQYDEVKITFNQLASANLGTIRIYGAIFTKTCAPTISCNETYYLNQSVFPAYIISERTGVSGVVAALNGVEDAWNVVSSNKEDFATIKIDIGVAGKGSISVRDAKTVYPVGTTAGFTIGKLGSLLELDLFPSITISTYLDGAFQESRTGTNLLNLELLGIPILGSGANLYNVGFVTTKSFNEVQISVGALAGVDPLFNATRVYGAYVDTRTSLGGELVCNPIANPDFNVTQINVEVPGNVKTNDKLPTATTYGPAVPAGTNPVGGTLNLQNTGSYTFVSTVTGVFVYNVPASFPPAPPIDVPLVITVTDPDLNTNPPIANIDIASVKGHATTPVAVKINVKINDGPGNVSGSLGVPTINTNPAHGSVVVDGTGKIDYTPNAAFFGKDEFVYNVCETPSGLCASAKVIVTVNDGAVTNITVATDDYYGGAKGVTLTGNLLDNDTDPEGNIQKTVVDPAPGARVASVSPAGTFSLDSTGNFTFVPTVGFSGPAEFIYQIYDDGAPSATAAATVHFLVSPNNPLPVNLVRFDAKREGSRAVLSWTTSEEVNADRFEVEQSNNAKSWTQIGTVLTTGAERRGSTYGFTDPEVRSGVSYYRLKNVDKDNTFEFSTIISVSFEGSGSVADIYPNPAVGRINLNKLDVSQVARVQLVSQLGQAVYSTNKLSANYINVNGLNPGVYLLKIELKDGTTTNHKVIVSK